MKIITKVKISFVIMLALSMQAIAETSSASTASAIQIDNNIPEPGMILALGGLLLFIKFFRK